MEYNELLSLIQENMHPDCWVKSGDQDNLYTFTLRDNISVSIVEEPKEEENRAENEFTERFINKTASSHYYTLKYNGAVVKNVLLLMVDGGRAFIPTPKLVDRNYIQDDELILSVTIDRLTFEGRYIHDDTVNFLDTAKYSYQDSLIK